MTRKILLIVRIGKRRAASFFLSRAVKVLSGDDDDSKFDDVT